MAIDLGDIPSGTSPSPAEQLQIRKAIGVGTTDPVTFLAQTLTGQSLTVSQSTNLLNLATTWDTIGNPSLIYGRVTNNNSGPTSNLIDLGTFAGGSLFSVTKAGAVTAQSLNIIQTASANIFSTSAAALQTSGYLGVARAINLIDTAGISWSSTSTLLGATGTNLLQDAAGILAQRNGVNAQAFRVYNNHTGTNTSDWFEINWQPTGTNSVLVGTTHGGGGSARPMSFVVGGVAHLTMTNNTLSVVRTAGQSNAIDVTNGTDANLFIGVSASGAADKFSSIGTYTAASSLLFRTNGTERFRITAAGNLIAGLDNTYDIGASGANRPKDIHIGGNYLSAGGYLTLGVAGGVSKVQLDGRVANNLTLTNNSQSDFGRLNFGTAADTHPAIARDGAGIKFTGAAAGSTSWIKVPAVAVSALPAAATAGVGARAFVNDALTPVFGSAVANGGSATVPVYSTGSAWNVG